MSIRDELLAYDEADDAVTDLAPDEDGRDTDYREYDEARATLAIDNVDTFAAYLHLLVDEDSVKMIGAAVAAAWGDRSDGFDWVSNDRRNETLGLDGMYDYRLVGEVVQAAIIAIIDRPNMGQDQEEGTTA